MTAHGQFIEDLRDDIAMHALQALLQKDSNWREGWGRCTKTEIAEEAYAFADAMMIARTNRKSA